jgi:signal transduction histidine kinase
VAVTLILGGAALLMDHMIDAEMAQRFDASLASQARAIAALVQADASRPNLEDLRHASPHLLLGDAQAAYAVQCEDGSRFRSAPPPVKVPPDWVQRATRVPQFTNLAGAGQALRAVWFRFRPELESDGGAAPSSTGTAAPERCALLLLQPRNTLDDILFTIDGILWIIPLLALLAVIVLTPALVRRGLRPLAMLGERMRTIGPAAPDQRLPSGETNELAPLVERFNEVLERMQAGMLRERRFAGALAHETRTRLAELRTLVDVESRYPSDRPMPQVLAEVGAISGELEDTVTGLLLLTRLEAGIETVQREQVDVGAVISRQVQAVAELAAHRDLRMQVLAPAQPVFLTGDASVLGIVLGNLLRNAAAYAPRGSEVRLAWDVASLRLVNAAPDLTSDDVAQFGSRYWRKRSGESDGAHAGLGLSLAAAAASALGLGLAFHLDGQQRLEAKLAWPRGRVSSGD